jgi:hypothetical protein
VLSKRCATKDGTAASGLCHLSRRDAYARVAKPFNRRLHTPSAREGELQSRSQYHFSAHGGNRANFYVKVATLNIAALAFS